MYGGQSEEVTIQFERNVLGAVYDKFGEVLKITKMNNGRFETTVTVQISPTFWGWVFQFGGQLTITSPVSIISEYHRRVRNCIPVQ